MEENSPQPLTICLRLLTKLHGCINNKQRPETELHIGVKYWLFRLLTFQSIHNDYIHVGEGTDSVVFYFVFVQINTTI
jgi:hypothetical protein